jgi:two-component system response regulator MprA
VSERILIVDDDPPVRRMLSRTLVAEGYAVVEASDGISALAAVEREIPDLIVLDIAMPGIDGLEVCRMLRAQGRDLPVILVTARGGIPDRIVGLDAGADDYLGKPFDSQELLARIRALLRRGRQGAAMRSVAGITLDVDTRTVRAGEREIDLTPREAALLELLMRRPNTVITREFALSEIWDHEAGVGVVDRYIGFLRLKLAGVAEIRTVRGVGFMLVA